MSPYTRPLLVFVVMAVLVAKEGKKRMKMVGRVEVPPEAFVAALSAGTEVAKGDRK